MNKVKRSLDNQAIGLVPLLLFMFLDNYFSYVIFLIVFFLFFTHLKLTSKLLKTNIQKALKRLYFRSKEDI